MVERLFLAVPRGCLQFVIVVFPDHTHLLFLGEKSYNKTIIDFNFRRHKDLSTLKSDIHIGLAASASYHFFGHVYLI